MTIKAKMFYEDKIPTELTPLENIEIVSLDTKINRFLEENPDITIKEMSLSSIGALMIYREADTK